MIILLSGKTRKGNNRVKENGTQWRVVKSQDQVQCLDNKEGLLIQAVLTDEIRWIATHNDADFSWRYQ